MLAERFARDEVDESEYTVLSDLPHRLNPVLRGWTAYFCHWVSQRTLAYLSQFAWCRVVGWRRKRHPGISWRGYVDAFHQDGDRRWTDRRC